MMYAGVSLESHQTPLSGRPVDSSSMFIGSNREKQGSGRIGGCSNWWFVPYPSPIKNGRVKVKIAKCAVSVTYELRKIGQHNSTRNTRKAIDSDPRRRRVNDNIVSSLEKFRYTIRENACAPSEYHRAAAVQQATAADVATTGGPSLLPHAAIITTRRR